MSAQKFVMSFEFDPTLLEQQLQNDAAEAVIDRCYADFDEKVQAADKESRRLLAKFDKKTEDLFDGDWRSHSTAEMMLDKRIAKFVNDNADVIIDRAASKLAATLAKRKVTKDLVDGIK